MTADEIKCPRCQRAWEGDESDAMFARFVTCADCACTFTVDTIEVYVTTPVRVAWITGGRGGFGGRFHKTRAAAEKEARRTKTAIVSHVVGDLARMAFTIIETYDVTPPEQA